MTDLQTRTPSDLAGKRPAQVVRTTTATRQPSVRTQARRGNPTARKVWTVLVFLILLSLSTGFALSMVQQYS